MRTFLGIEPRTLIRLSMEALIHTMKTHYFIARGPLSEPAFPI